MEVRIVGHTDDVPIGKPQTRELHPTNVHLSVHRSISVRSALVSAGVEPVRIQVAGYGEYRPVIENRPGGTPENRRVEVYLTPMPTGIAAAPRPAASPSVSAETTEPMK
jgi:chemotaxis protein MotB